VVEEVFLGDDTEEIREDVWGPPPQTREILESILRGNSTMASIVEDTNIKPKVVTEILKTLQYCTLIDTVGQRVSLTRGGMQALRRSTRYG